MRAQLISVKPAPEAETEILNKKPRLIELAETAPFPTIQKIYQKRGYEQLKESIRLWYGIAFLPDITVYIEPEHRLGLYTLFGKLELFYEAFI